MRQSAEVLWMGRRYAAVLGMLAFAAILVRGTVRGGAPESVMDQAVVYLFVFAVLGALVGSLAQWIVEDAVRGKLASQIAEQQTQAGNKLATGTTK